MAAQKFWTNRLNQMWASNAKDELNPNGGFNRRVLQIYLPKTREPRILKTKRTKHNYIYRMTARNFEDKTA